MLLDSRTRPSLQFSRYHNFLKFSVSTDPIHWLKIHLQEFKVSCWDIIHTYLHTYTHTYTLTCMHTYIHTKCDRKVMRLIFQLPTFLFPFKTVPLGSYTPTGTFPLLVAALGVFNRYCFQHVRYTLLGVFYKDVLERLRKRALRVRQDIADKWMLHHDNAPCETAFSVTKCLTSKAILVVPHHHIHLTLAPVNFLFFP